MYINVSEERKKGVGGGWGGNEMVGFQKVRNGANTWEILIF